MSALRVWQIDVTVVVEGETFEEAWNEAFLRLSDPRFVEEGATVTELEGLEV